MAKPPPEKPTLPELKHGMRESERYFGRWIYVSEKKGGKHDSGVLGGVFMSHNFKFKALFKREKKSAKVLGEFLAGEIWEKIAPEFSARTFLSTHNEKVQLPDKNGEHIYIGSLWMPNYKELYLDIEEKRKKEGLPMPSWWPHANGKVSFGHLLDTLTGFYSHALSSYNYQGFPQVMATSLLLADFGVHSANVGVVRKEGKPPKLVRIDYGSSFKGIDSEDIHPNSRSRHLPLLQKGGGFSSNYYASYPSAAKVQPEFADELDRVAAFDIKPVISNSLHYAGAYFGRNVFQSFAKRIGLEKEKVVGVEKTEIIDVISEYLSEKIAARQKSLKEYSSQIKTDLCIRKQDKGWDIGSYKNHLTGKITTFEDVVQDNPDYFKKLVESKQPVHFREKMHKRNKIVLSAMVKKAAAEILERMEEEKEIDDKSNTSPAEKDQKWSDTITSKDEPSKKKGGFVDRITQAASTSMSIS